MPERRALCWAAAAALSLAGLALATYLSAAYLTGSGPACGAGGGCGSVTTSEYAKLLGIPVAMIGMAGYSALLLGSLAALGLGNPPAPLRIAPAVAAGAGFAFSAYLTATQAFLLNTYCVYCLTSAALMTAIFLLTLAAALPSRNDYEHSPA